MKTFPQTLSKTLRGGCLFLSGPKCGFSFDILSSCQRQRGVSDCKWEDIMAVSIAFSVIFLAHKRVQAEFFLYRRQYDI